MSAYAAFNPFLVESELVHRVAVDRLKWQLGEPIPWPAYPLVDPDWPLYPHSYHPWAGGSYHYSLGFRDGLSATTRSLRSTEQPQQQQRIGWEPAANQKKSGASSPGRCESPTGKFAKAEFAGAADLMEFPSAGYRRALCAYPVSTDTSHDELLWAWPYGCKPFYYRRADPPSVRYC